MNQSIEGGWTVSRTAAIEDGLQGVGRLWYRKSVES